MSCTYCLTTSTAGAAHWKLCKLPNRANNWPASLDQACLVSCRLASSKDEGHLLASDRQMSPSATLAFTGKHVLAFQTHTCSRIYERSKQNGFSLYVLRNGTGETDSNCTHKMKADKSELRQCNSEWIAPCRKAALNCARRLIDVHCTVQSCVNENPWYEIGTAVCSLVVGASTLYVPPAKLAAKLFSRSAAWGQFISSPRLAGTSISAKLGRVWMNAKKSMPTVYDRAQAAT